MIRIKITQCWDGLMWYSSHVGETFTAYREYEESYLVRTSASGYSNIVLKTDCIILEGETNNE